MMMSSITQQEAHNNDVVNKPHVVCLPFPVQGHINPMLKLAKLFYQRGFHVTFVNNEYNHRRLLKSRGLKALDGLSGFRFETISDGLPTDIDGSDDATQDVGLLAESVAKNCLEPFRRLILRLNDMSSTGSDVVVPPVSCVVSDTVMPFAIDAVKEFGIPIVQFWTSSACGFIGCSQLPHLVDEGFTPLKDESYLTNGYLDTIIDWIPGIKEIRLWDLPSFVRTTNPADIMLRLARIYFQTALRASAIIINTFEALDHDLLEAISSDFPPVLAIGPLHRLVEKTDQNNTLLHSIGSNLWREENECLHWLDSKEKNSVVYVNFGSIMVMSREQFKELAWGLANSMKPFVWIIRPDLVIGDSAILPSDFLEETKERGILAGWCNQERVLSHPAIGGFLTHCGWNSTLESLSAGVPVICWPFFGDQQPNCRFLCQEWGVGVEIDNDVKREKVEMFVRELIDGERGKKMKQKALEWKRKAEEATNPGGSSLKNFDKLIKEFLLH